MYNNLLDKKIFYSNISYNLNLIFKIIIENKNVYIYKFSTGLQFKIIYQIPEKLNTNERILPYKQKQRK